MSEIDQFKHQCLGWIRCPTSYEIVYGNSSVQEIPIYRLEECAWKWKAKVGDVIVGGGSGEAAALRISMPESILFFTYSDWDNFEVLEELFQAFWSPTQAFVFGEGYRKLGWKVSQPLELWVVEKIVAFLIHSYPELYCEYVGHESMELDDFCRLAP